MATMAPPTPGQHPEQEQRREVLVATCYNSARYKVDLLKIFQNGQLVGYKLREWNHRGKRQRQNQTHNIFLPGEASIELVETLQQDMAQEGISAKRPRERARQFPTQVAVGQ